MTQIVMPNEFRCKILKLAHESHFGCHMGVKKTGERILQNFYWPGMFGDIKRFVQSCDTCQRHSQKGRVKPAPLELMPIIEVPFQQVAIDLIGPINPASKNGYKYILTMIDFATRYPEALPLENIETITVAEALMNIFSRVGIPSEILSDRGTQFTSKLMAELCRMLNVKQIFTTPYHPAANGLVERFNGTLKTLLKKTCDEQPKLWDKYINSILFAYRDTPQTSLGFTPFEMIYGRNVRGPLNTLRDILEDKSDTSDITKYEYIITLKEKLETVCNLAHKELFKAQRKYQKHYDKRTSKRMLKPGDSVLLLLPSDSNKLLVQWKGPFKVLERVNRVDYVIEINGKNKTFHINMLKQYFQRNKFPKDTENVVQLIKCVEDDDTNSCLNPNIPLVNIKRCESLEDICINDNLSLEQLKELISTLKPFEQIITDIPGRTNLEKCSMLLYQSVSNLIQSHQMLKTQ